MFAYQQNKCAECLPCTVEVFKGLTQAPATAKKIDEVRRLNACGQVAEAKALKGTLPGLLFQTREVLVSEGKAKYNKGMKGRWRLQAQCVLNGLVMCDFDHVENPREKFAEWGLFGTDLRGFINKDTALSADENSVSQNESRVNPCQKTTPSYPFVAISAGCRNKSEKFWQKSLDVAKNNPIFAADFRLIHI